MANGLTKKDAKVQATTFLHVAGADTLEVYNTFTWENADDKSKVDIIMEKFYTFCILCKNVTWERHVFSTCNQRVGKTIDQYDTDLQTKVRSCDFSELKDSLIRDCIVCGIICGKTRSRLLKESDLTLQKALDIICRANKTTATQMKILGASNTDRETVEYDVHRIQKRQKSEPRKHSCDRCGTQHNQHQSCPAQGAECYSCG